MSELSMKHLSESDLPFLYSLLTDSHVAEKLHWQPSSLDELKSYYQNEWRDEDEVHFIIRWKDYKIGWLKINNLKGKDTLWISMLAILPYYSGRGLAKQALCFAELFTINHGKTELAIQTTIDNLSAIALYIKSGFILEEYLEDTGYYVFKKQLLKNDEHI